MFRDPSTDHQLYGRVNIQSVFLFGQSSRNISPEDGSRKTPETVLDVILHIPDTDNVRVHEDLADAALAMPAELAAHWASKEAEWIETAGSPSFSSSRKIRRPDRAYCERGSSTRRLCILLILYSLYFQPKTKRTKRKKRSIAVYPGRKPVSISGTTDRSLRRIFSTLVSVAKTETL